MEFPEGWTQEDVPKLIKESKTVALAIQERYNGLAEDEAKISFASVLNCCFILIAGAHKEGQSLTKKGRMRLMTEAMQLTSITFKNIEQRVQSGDL